MNWWNILTTVDEIHNYLQLLLPILVFLTIRFVFRSNWFSTFSYFATSLLTVILINLNSESQLSFVINLILFGLVLLPLIIWFLILKFLPKLIPLVETFGSLILFAFCLTQLIYSGCVIHYYQNYLSKKHLAIETWRPVELFMSEFVNPDILRLIFVSICVLIGFKFVQVIRKTCT